jgi:hypothetical protein
MRSDYFAPEKKDIYEKEFHLSTIGYSSGGSLL